MRKSTSMATTLAVAGMLSLTGCFASGGGARPGVVYARYGPPASVYETRVVAPGPGYVWIPGHHEWRGQNYVWIGGRYELPARGYRRYEPGRWRHDRNGWFWVEGRWR
jgi:WXXGXW repeat (2 copies)